MTDNDDKRANKKPGDAVFQKIGWEIGPQHIDRDLEALWFLYFSDPGTNLAALETIARIAEHWWDDDVDVDRRDPIFGLQPGKRVPVPWWVVHLIARSWSNYRKDPTKKLGDAFLVEGGGRGRHKRVSLFDTQLKSMRLALEVADRILSGEQQGNKVSREQAIFDVAEEFGASEGTVKKAFDEFGGHCLARLQDLDHR